MYWILAATLIFILFMSLKFREKNSEQGDGKEFSVTKVLQLSPKARLVAVRYMERELLLAIGEEKVSLLSEVSLVDSFEGQEAEEDSLLADYLSSQISKDGEFH